MYRPSTSQKSDVKRIEEEIQELREPIEKTIMDVRELISEIDSAVITAPQPRQNKPDVKRLPTVEKRTDDRQGETRSVQAGQQPRIPDAPTLNAEKESIDAEYLDVNLYVVTSFILRLLGNQNLERILLSVRSHGESVDWLKKQMRDVAELILRGSKTELGVEKYPFPGSDAYLLGFYLVSLFLRRPGDPNLGLLVITLSRILLGESLVRG